MFWKSYTGLVHFKYNVCSLYKQGSVVGPILFNLDTTSLSTLIANTYISHHLYADDTQLFTSFVPKDFPLVINQLQSSVSTISSWMTANLLTLNPSKTEFMIIGLPQQLSKIHSPSLSLPPAQPILPCSYARNICFVFDSFFSFSQQISKLSSSCYYHLHDLRRIRNSLDHKRRSHHRHLACPLPSRLLLLTLLLSSCISTPPSSTHKKCTSQSRFSNSSSLSNFSSSPLTPLA